MQPLQLDGQSAFMYGQRPVQDKYWGYAFLVFAAFIVGGGIYSVAARNTLFLSAFDPQYTSDPHNCPSPHWDLSGKSRRCVSYALCVLCCARSLAG